MEEKEKMIGDLYALRAGLSVLSEQKDEIDRIREKAIGEYAAIGKAFVAGREIFAFGNHYQATDLALGTADWATKRFYEDIKKDFYDAAHFWAKSRWHQDEATRKKFAKPEDINRKAGVEIFVKWLGTAEAEQFYKKEYNADHDHLIGGLFKKKEKQAQWVRIETYKKLLADLPSVKKKNAVVEQKCESAVKTEKEAAEVVYEELGEEYAKLLDPRDWKYLDLVIFYLETGRADSMKEALQLLEREVQTQRIIGAIQEASARICRTIASAAAVISSQLNTISSQLSTVISQQQTQIGQNQRLIAAADMQNALLNKANATSEQLMGDVAYIKNYGTNAIGR